nr:hypothetical protein [Tanacetum cinerariifolium]
GEGLANPTEPHHTLSPQEYQLPQSDYSPQHDSPPLSHQAIIPKPIPHELQAPTKTLTPRRLTKRAIRIAQSKALSPDADEPASLSRDDRHEEAFPTVSSLVAGMQQRLHELMELCTSLQRKQSQMAGKIKDQDIEISGLTARVKSLEDKERRREEPIQEDAPITGGIIDIGEELGADKSTENGRNDTEEMVNMLSSIESGNILSSRGAAFSTASVSSVDVFLTAGFPTVSAIFTTASVITPYTRRSRGITIGSLQHMRILIISAKDKGKEKVTETKVPKKKKLQEQIDAQVAREMEEEFARENQRLSEQAERESEIAIIHAEEELKLMIEGLDRSNEVIAKHLNFFPLEEISPKDTKTSESPIPVSPSSLIGSSSPVRMAPKRTSTSTAPAMNQAVIWQLINDHVVAALEAQAANMANTDNTNRNLEPRETFAARKCTYKEFMSHQPFNFKGLKGAIGLIHLMFSPNHPTFDIEDAFSSNFPNYIPASSNYSSASSGNTPSESSNNSYGLVPMASPTLSVFHDDLYIKNSFFSRKYCHQRNKAVKRSSSSTSAIHQAFEMGESSHKTSLERHEE